MTQEQYLKNLKVPDRCVDVILDTDAFNEIDDQFAIAYMMRSPERIRAVGICAAPFLNPNSISPKDGMEKSYREILKLLSLMKRDDFSDRVYTGSDRFMTSEREGVDSPAAHFIAETAGKYSSENPLYVVAIGAITNVASAVLLAPEAMRENTVIVWLGGHALDWAAPNDEFNLQQDIAAARVVFDCGAPLVLLPCNGVVSTFCTTEPELNTWLKGKNPLATYLAENAAREANSYAAGKPWSRCIWDVTAVAWLLNDRERFMDSYQMPAPIPEYDHRWAKSPFRRPITYVYNIRRDALFADLFGKLAE